MKLPVANFCIGSGCCRAPGHRARCLRGNLCRRGRSV